MTVCSENESIDAIEEEREAMEKEPQGGRRRNDRYRNFGHWEGENDSQSRREADVSIESD